MPKKLFPKGIIKIIDESGIEHLAEYMGRQKDFNCSICRKGHNCYTFNIFESEEEYKEGMYETFGYGREHIKLIRVI